MFFGSVVLSVMSACSTQPKPESPLFPSQEAIEKREQAEVDCVDAWVNTEMSAEAIDDALSKGILSVGSDGSYYTNHETIEHDEWMASGGAGPASGIFLEVNYGPGCPFAMPGDTPTAENHAINQAAEECLYIWITNYASPDTISDGIETGAIVYDSNSLLYRANVSTNIYAESDDSTWFHLWRHRHNIPWLDIRTEVVFGSGCPIDQP